MSHDAYRRRMAKKMADARAAEEQAERMNPLSGRGATPSMGLSQYRGGKAHSLYDHLENPRRKIGGAKFSVDQRQARAFGLYDNDDVVESVGSGRVSNPFRDLESAVSHYNKVDKVRRSRSPSPRGGLRTGKYEGEGIFDPMLRFTRDLKADTERRINKKVKDVEDANSAIKNVFGGSFGSLRPDGSLLRREMPTTRVTLPYIERPPPDPCAGLDFIEKERCRTTGPRKYPPKMEDILPKVGSGWNSPLGNLIMNKMRGSGQNVGESVAEYRERMKRKEWETAKEYQERVNKDRVDTLRRRLPPSGLLYEEPKVPFERVSAEDLRKAEEKVDKEVFRRKGAPLADETRFVPKRGKGKEDGRKARAQIVKKVMAERGCSMIEASKYVKEHGLY